MKTTSFIRWSALSVALLAGIGATPLRAQMSIEAEAGPFVGGALFLSDASGEVVIDRQGGAPVVVQDGRFRNGLTVGVHAGVRFADRMSVEGSYAWTPTRLHASEGLEAQGGAVRVDAIRYGLATSYHFAPRGRFEPFVGIGMSGETVSYAPFLAWERRSSMAGTLQLGGNVWVTDGLRLRVNAARDFLTNDENPPHDRLAVTVGLTARQRIR